MPLTWIRGEDCGRSQGRGYRAIKFWQDIAKVVMDETVEETGLEMRDREAAPNTRKYGYVSEVADIRKIRTLLPETHLGR